MSASRRRNLALLLAVVVGVVLPGAGTAEEFGTVAFVNVTVLPMDSERVLEGQTVLVRGRRIVAVGPADSVELPATATRLDGTGKYLMPGVAEMHGHYPQDVESQFFEDILFLYVANGVTMVRGMQGAVQHLPLRYAIERGERLGPRLLVSAPMMVGNGPNALTSVEEAQQRVRDAKTAGFDHLKVHEGLSVEVYDAIANTAAEVGITFSGHVSNFVGLFNALEKGQATIDHLDNFLEAMIDDKEAVAELGLFDLGRLAGQIDDSKIDRVIAATHAAGAGVVPTMALWEGLFGSRSGADWLGMRPETRYMPTAMVQGWIRATDQRVAQFGQDPEAIANILALRRRVLRALFEAGVPVLLGTDSPQIFSVPGFSIHHEMKLMVETGMTPYQVLDAGTRQVAAFYGETWDYGTVAVGQRADLVLLNSNPLERIDNFADRAGVMVNGRWLDGGEIDVRLAQIEARVASAGS